MRIKKKKRHKSKLKNIFLTILIILISISTIYISNKYQSIYFKTSNNRSKDENTSLEEPSPKVTKASMIMVGDNLIHSSIYKEANEIANGGVRNLNTNAYDFTKMYSLVKPIVSTYDIAYYNQETILGGSELGVSDYPTFNSPYEVGNTMIDTGFNLVSLATNHTMDRGAKAVINSRNYWNAHENILAVGSYQNLDEKNEINIKEVNNITYTMLNYTYGTNGMPVPEGKEYLVNVWPTDLDNINNPDKDIKYQEYKKQVKKDIEQVRSKVDILIVAMHWGVEYQEEPTAYQKDMAEYLASLHVDLIVGTHPHIIEPIEWIDDTLVIYSLGNFISAQYQNKVPCVNYKCTVGLMTSLDIVKTEENHKTTIKIENIDNELIYNYYNQSTWSKYKIIPFSNPEIKEYLPNYQSVYNNYKQVVQKYDNSIHVKDEYEG